MPNPIPLADQLVFVQRARTLWPRLYAHWVAEGRMTEAEQAYEVACLAAVLATLEYLARPGQADLFATPEEHTP